MSRKVLLGALGLVVAVAAATGAAWAIDRARGIEVPTAADYGSTPVVIHAPKGDIRTTAAELGMTVDTAATASARDDARHAGPGSWFRGVLGRRSAPLIVRVDATKTRQLIAAKDPSSRIDPVEPSIVGTSDGIAVREGKAGRGLDPAGVVVALRKAARSGHRPVEVTVAPTPLAPRHTLAEARALATEARRLTADPLPVRAGAITTTISTKRLRSWVRSTDDLTLDLDIDEVHDALTDDLADATRPAVDAAVRLVDGHPIVIPAQIGVQCCDGTAAGAIVGALRTRPASAVSLPLKTVQPDRTTADVEALKIVEQIGSFTTRYPAGQERVKNIHRIADLVRGTLIGPGGRLSLNDKVGERTTEKGFVVAHSIADGIFVDTVGGGVSQFATTLFNAAFFAGLDMPSYQSHSIYISRYPYGREATVSWTKPDLVIANTTPYGVLIDTSYTSTSLTVTLWSTTYAHGEQTAQSQSPVGNCTRVKTERTRTYVDGRTKVDYVYATYRPKEGVQC